MKDQNQIVNIINTRIDNHKKAIDECVDNLRLLKGKELSQDIKMKLVNYASTIAEQKASIKTLSELLNELES